MNTIRTQEEVGNLIDNYSEQYSNLKFLHEMQMINLKNSLKYEFDELHQIMKEEGVSKQLLDFHRSSYEKKTKLRSLENTFVVAKSDEELYDILFTSIIRSFKDNTNSNNQFYIDTYLNSKDLIINYYTRYFYMKAEIQKLKDNQSNELNELVEEIKDDGIAFYLIPSTYKQARMFLKIKDESKKEFFYYKERYNAIENKLISNMERIRQETLVNYENPVEVQITREEAIERISYIKTQIDSENYGILKEEWTVSEDRYYVIGVKDKCEKLKRTLSFYVGALDDYDVLDNNALKKLMDAKGIRLNRNSCYIIKDKHE